MLRSCKMIFLLRVTLKTTALAQVFRLHLVLTAVLSLEAFFRNGALMGKYTAAVGKILLEEVIKPGHIL